MANVQQVKATGGAPDPKVYARDALADVFKALGIDPKIKLTQLDPESKKEAQAILKEFEALGPGKVTDADLAAAQARLQGAVVKDAVVKLNPGKVPAGAEAMPKKLSEAVLEQKDPKTKEVTHALHPSLQKTAVGTMLSRLGFKDVNNLPPQVAAILNEHLTDTKFNINNQGHWDTLYRKLAPHSPKIQQANGTAASAPVDGSTKVNGNGTAAQAVDGKKTSAEDIKKVGTETGKGVQGNWLNAMAANMSSSAKKNGSATGPDAHVAEAADQLIKEAGLGDVTPAERKAIEDVIRASFKGAMTTAKVGGEVETNILTGKAMSNAFMQLADATQDPQAKMGAAMATRFQQELSSLPPEAQVELGQQLAPMTASVILAAVQAKLGRPVDQPQAAMAAMAEYLQILGIDPAQVAQGVKEVGATQATGPTQAQRFQSKLDRSIGAMERTVSRDCPELKPAMAEVRQAFNDGDLPKARALMVQVGRALIKGEVAWPGDPNHKVDPNRVHSSDPGVGGAKFADFCLNTAQLTEAAMQAQQTTNAASASASIKHVKVTPEGKKAAEAAFKEIAQGLDPKSMQGQRLMEALEQIYSATPSKRPSEVITTAYAYLGEKMGLDLGGKGAQMAMLADHHAGTPQGDEIRKIALRDVAQWAVNPDGFAQAYQAAQAQAGGMGPVHFGGSPVTGGGPNWALGAHADRNMRSMIGLSILNDPSLSFEDKLFLFMMYMAMFAEQDELEKMREIAELDQRQELKQRQTANANIQFEKAAGTRKEKEAAVGAAESSLAKLKKDPNATEEQIKKAEGLVTEKRKEVTTARAAEEVHKGEVNRLRTEEQPPKSKDMLSAELRRLEQWRGMLLDMVKQIMEERNRRIRQIWQG